MQNVRTISFSYTLKNDWVDISFLDRTCTTEQMGQPYSYSMVNQDFLLII